MNRPRDLTREQLERIADEVQQALYLSYDDETEGFCWDPEKEWSGFDVCEAISGTLSQLSMVPNERKPFA